MHQGGFEERRVYGLVAGGAILLGAILRLLIFSEGASLWTDEVMLALNVGRRGWMALVNPLDYGQAAPVLYLWSVKLAW